MRKTSSRPARAGQLLAGLAIMALMAVDGSGAAARAAGTGVAAPPALPSRTCTPATLTYRPRQATAQPAPSPAELQSAVLAEMNAARRAVGVEDDLIWDAELARGAQFWASTIARTGNYYHDPDSIGGELITGGLDGAMWKTGDLVDWWVSEKAWFTNTAFPAAVAACNDSGNGPGHYYGIIRRAAHRVGCGVAGTSPVRYIVCRLEPGYAPPGEYAYPTTPKPWPARDADIAPQPWVEGARIDVAAYEKAMLAVNAAVRPGLAWDGGLANDAQQEARGRMLTDTPWVPAPAGPAPAANQFVTIVNNSANGDPTNFPAPDVQFRDWINNAPNAASKAQLAGSGWTRVGCGTAIRPVGTENRRIVICRYA